MSTEPAVPATSGLRMSTLHDRLQRLLGRTSAEALAGRLLPARPTLDTAERPHLDGFYWLQIPEWLADEFGLTATAEGRAMFADLCWIQYCVYCVFRVQDDLFDGEAADPSLAIQANHLLVEASHCAAKHFHGESPFWEVFRESIDSTSRTIVEVDRTQRSRQRSAERELKLYRRLSACLEIASAGVTLATGRERAWKDQLSPALGYLSAAHQIVDDLHDISDDLRQGRVNYAAWFFSQPVFSPLAEAVEAVIAANLVEGRRLVALKDQVDGLIEEAIGQLDTGSYPRVRELLVKYRRSVREQLGSGPVRV